MANKEKRPYGLKLLLSPSLLFKSRRGGQTQTEAEGAQANKKAIAIVVYQDHQAVVQLRNAIRMQGLGTENGISGFDIGVFQDGLKEDDEASIQAYNLTAAEALKLVDSHRFVRQEKHLGHDLHLAEIERFLFEDLNYELVVFLDNPDISPKYFEQLQHLFETLQADSRIAALSMGIDSATGYQVASPNQPLGLMRHAWLATKPVIDAYSHLHSLSLPDYQKQLLVDWWASKLGFKRGNLTRIDARRSAHAALRLAEVACSEPVAEQLADIDYANIISKQAEHYLENSAFDYQGFAQKLLQGDIRVDVNILTAPNQTSISDMVAAYKFFLKRLPENFQVIESRVGIPSDLMFKDFLLSDEFLSHEDYWPAVIEAAKKVIQLNNLKNASVTASETVAEENSNQ
ncbi:MAG: hypothetical protein RLZ92_1107 [Pseudomonadota bacterium]